MSSFDYLESKSPETLRVLVAVDGDCRNSLTFRQWTLAVVSALTTDGVETFFLGRALGDSELSEEVSHLGATYLEAEDFGEESLDHHGVISRYRAGQVVRLANEIPDIDLVITQGLHLSQTVAGGGAVRSRHWAIIDDDPSNPRFFEPRELKILESLSPRAKLILTGSSRIRSQIESLIPSATSKVRLLPSFPFSVGLQSLTKKPGDKNYVLDLARCRESTSTLDFSLLAEQARALRFPPRLVIVGISSPPTEEDRELLERTGLSSYPGLTLQGQSVVDCTYINSSSTLLIPQGNEQAITDILICQAASVGIRAVELPLGRPSMETVAKAPALAGGVPRGFKAAFPYDLPDYHSIPFREAARPLRVLLAGADFKFAGDLVDTLIQRGDIEVKVDLFEANAKPQPTKSTPLLQWADVIIAEFASRNAIWYSRNVSPHQDLIVHLHGYELLSDWIDELRVSACSAIVVASEFYREKAIVMKGWPAETVRVIPNSVNPADLARPKHPDARFHLGMVGTVPILKRPDRALDLLEALLREDERFVLHIKGRMPFDYAWEWKKSAHQDSYREFYRRIGDNPTLASHIAFEGFSPDMGNWLQKIGWLLSPSTRETFHLSAIEGAISGAVPLAWRREGSDEIIGADHNVDTTEEAVKRILKVTRESADFVDASENARRFAARYGVDRVREQWLTLLFSLADGDNSQGGFPDPGMPFMEKQVFDAVTSYLQSLDTESALAVLDENIPVTSSSTSALKDLELYVRGAAASDERRLTHFLPSREPLSLIGTQSQLLVRLVGRSRPELVQAGLERHVIDVIPPRYCDLPETEVSPGTGDFAGETDATIHVSDQIRLDRWIQQVKMQIQLHVLRSGFDRLIVQGPWWLAQAAVFAGDQLDLPVVWIIEDSRTLDLIQSVETSGTLSTSSIAQGAFTAFEGAALKIAATRTAVSDVRTATNLDAVITRSSTSVFGLPQWHPNVLTEQISQCSNTRSSSPPVELLRPLESLRIGIIGNDSFVSDLRSVVAEARRLSLTGDFSAITADLDAVIIAPGTARNSSLVQKLSHCLDEELTTPARIFDRGRLLGATTIFLWESQAIIPQRLHAVARKADAIVSSSMTSVSRVMTLHPTAVRLVGLWDMNLDLADRMTLALRSSGVPVVPTSLPTSSGMELPVAEGFPELPEDISQPPMEKIAVIISGVDDQSLRRQLSDQTLPSGLFEVTTDGTNADYVLRLSSLDSIGADYLLSLWLSAGPNTIVLDLPSAQALGRGDEDFRTPLPEGFVPGDGQLIPTELDASSAVLVPSAPLGNGWRKPAENSSGARS